MLRRTRAGVLAELGHVGTELRRLKRQEHPRVPVALAVLMTILVVIWGNAVVFLGRLLEAPAPVTLVAHPALAISVTLLLVRRGWRLGTLGFSNPEPQPPSRRLRALLAVLAVTAGVACAGVLALEPSKRLDVIRLVVGTAAGEELLHRSILLAVWSSSSARPLVVTAASSASFGAWHLVGAFHGGAFHPLEVAVPALGTLVFLWARLRYQSVAAPIVLHVVTNLPGVVLGG